MHDNVAKENPIPLKMATARLTESTQQMKTILNKNYGPVDKAQPAGPRRPITGVRNLNTKDIEGAQVTK